MGGEAAGRSGKVVGMGKPRPQGGGERTGVGAREAAWSPSAERGESPGLGSKLQGRRTSQESALSAPGDSKPGGTCF